MQKIVPHILTASGELKRFENRILNIFNSSIIKIIPILELPNIDVVIVDNPKVTIPETGFCGFAISENLIYIYINPKHKNIEASLESEIQSTLAHELNHCARYRALGESRKNLLEALVTDGLADHFDIEINGTLPRPWSTALPQEKINYLLDLAKKDFENSEYDHAKWFFGFGDPEIPRWTGYTLGFYIVGNYLKKTGKKASEAYTLKAKDFLV